MKQSSSPNKKSSRSTQKEAPPKIYIIKDDGSYHVWEYESNISKNKEEKPCR